MVKAKIQGARALGVASAVSTATVIYVLWWSVFFGLTERLIPLESNYLLYAVIVCAGVCWRASVSEAGAGEPAMRRDLRRDISAAFLQALAGISLLACYLFLARDQQCSRLFLVTLGVLLFGGLLVNRRYIFPKILREVLKGHGAPRTLIMGEVEHLRANREWLQKQGRQGLDYIGYLCPEQTDGADFREPAIGGMQRLGDLHDLEQIMAEERPVIIISFDPKATALDLHYLKHLCDSHGARYLHVWDFWKTAQLNASIEEEEGLHLVSFRREPLLCPMNQALKKMVDLVISAPVSIILVPFLAVLVWVCQRFQSPGSLLFLQDRTGLHGEIFKIVKFRTMHTGEYLESKQATKDDDRIYAAGKIFRKLSVDEFPQFINVMLGDMSVVGPRPHMPEHDIEFAARASKYRIRMLVKPGITGLAQAQGKRGLIENDEDVAGRVESDLEYIENWSLWLDGKILMQTASSVIAPPKSAH